MRMTICSPPKTIPVLPYLALAVCVLLLSGCAAGGIVLSNVAVEKRDSQSIILQGASREGWRTVGVQRQGRPLEVTPDLTLLPGDEITTAAETMVSLGFPEETTVYVLPASRVTVDNASIRLAGGEVFIKKIRGFFKVHTQYTTAAAYGTEYFVQADQGGQVWVTVLEGRVSLQSPANRWQGLLIKEGEQSYAVADAQPRASQLSSDMLQQFQSRRDSLVNIFHELHRVRSEHSPDGGSGTEASIWSSVIGAAVTVIGVAASVFIYEGLKGDKDSDKTPPAEPPPTTSSGGGGQGGTPSTPPIYINPPIKVDTSGKKSGPRLE